ncbi:MAG TPA: signal peptidase I [Magnetospirillaceae bacterium]|nr:signal peptidase I [Magnetospirillaceae bacterium]
MFKAFLTVWLRPGNTITNLQTKGVPLFADLLLAALSGAAGMMGVADTLGIAGLSIVFVGGLGLLSGIINLYLVAFAIWLTAKPFGGQAAFGAVRTAVAWSGVPLVIAVPFLLLLTATHAAKAPWPLALVGLCGVWSWVALFFMTRRTQSFGLLKAFATCLLAFGIFVFLPVKASRAFLWEPYLVSSASMAPSLIKGDDLVVSKYSRQPQRGELIMFKLPRDPKQVYVKRVLGLPGDRIRLDHRVLYVNDQPVTRERLDEAGPFTRLRETLPEGRSYEIQDSKAPETPANNTQEYSVPEGQFFVLGDNRDNSLDSRFLDQVGYIPEKLLLGRVSLIFFSIDPEGNLSWSRAFKVPR